MRPIYRWARWTMAPHIIRGIVQRQLGVRPAGVRRILSGDAQVFEVDLPGAASVIFKAAPRAAGTIASEVHIHDMVGRLGVPVARVVALDTSRTLFPSTYAIFEKVDGTPLSCLRLSSAELPRVLGQAGQYLRLLHSIRAEGFGLLSERAYLRQGRLMGEHDTWRDAVRRLVEEATSDLGRHGVFDRAAAGSVRGLLSQFDDLLGACRASCLLHGDFIPRHMLIHPSGKDVSGIIDFGDRMAGDPAWDLARFARADPEEDERYLQYLLAGYEPDEELEEVLPIKIPLYHVFYNVATVQWHHQRKVSKLHLELERIQSAHTALQRALSLIS